MAQIVSSTPKGTHNIIDDDGRFIINPSTRAITYTSDEKLVLIQGDHKSETYTVEIPAEVEGRKIKDCDTIQVHYLNIGASSSERSPGVYIVPMDTVSETDGVVNFPWLIEGKAAKYVGSLGFAIRFMCTEAFDETTKDEVTGEDKTVTKSRVLYSWNTAPYTGVTVSSGIDNTEAMESEVIEYYAPAYEAWFESLEALYTGSYDKLTAYERTCEDNLDAYVDICKSNLDTKIDECKVELEGKLNNLNSCIDEAIDDAKDNLDTYSVGKTGVAERVATVNGDKLSFFLGTKAEYNELSEEVKTDDLFAIITDEAGADELVQDVEDLKDWKGSITDPTNPTPVPKANKATRAIADENGRSIVLNYREKSFDPQYIHEVHYDNFQKVTGGYRETSNGRKKIDAYLVKVDEDGVHRAIESDVEVLYNLNWSKTAYNIDTFEHDPLTLDFHTIWQGSGHIVTSLPLRYVNVLDQGKTPADTMGFNATFGFIGGNKNEIEGRRYTKGLFTISGFWNPRGIGMYCDETCRLFTASTILLPRNNSGELDYQSVILQFTMGLFYDNNLDNSNYNSPYYFMVLDNDRYPVTTRLARFGDSGNIDYTYMVENLTLEALDIYYK